MANQVTILRPYGDVYVTGEEFKTAIKTLGYTQASFGREAGFSPRTVAQYCSDGPPQHVALLLRLLAAERIPPAPRVHHDQPRQSVQDAKAAILPAVGTILSRARETGWQGVNIAGALAEIAEDFRDADERMAAITKAPLGLAKIA